VKEIHYSIRWLARSQRPGHHRSRTPGAGYEFRGHAPLLRELDARRLDVHASLRDPIGYAAGQWQVRTYLQRATIRLVVLADLSASMSADGTRRKMALLADLTATLAYSASRAGDAFGFFGADAHLRSEVMQYPTYARGAGLRLARACARSPPPARGRGPGRCRPQAGGRALVFLASDFHLPDATLEAAADSARAARCRACGVVGRAGARAAGRGLHQRGRRRDRRAPLPVVAPAIARALQC
jgi:uncharacterized protein (DUF58 family)